jgi:hypothetical protein
MLAALPLPPSIQTNILGKLPPAEANGVSYFKTRAPGEAGTGGASPI